MNTKYDCHFKCVPLGLDRWHTVTSEKGIAFFKDGFWLDKDFEKYDGIGDCKYWIAPSQIEYIEKTVDVMRKLNPEDV